MSEHAPLLIEIGCEEIPARMIQRAAEDLAQRLLRILDRAQLDHGEHACWGGSRRLAVRVEAVEGRQADQDKQVTGPPAGIAFDADGSPTKAALGFAKKQKIDADQLIKIETERGEYVGYRCRVEGETLADVLARELPPAVAGMSFAKTMRWGEGKHRWVRPVHWVLALHGAEPLPLVVFDVTSAKTSVGHRFLAQGPVQVDDADAYRERLRQAGVVIDPKARREDLAGRLAEEAAKLGGELVPDPGLLEEVADLVEWPGVVAGTIDRSFLELPRELLVTTLRYHQKCFSIQDRDGQLLPGFLAVANTDQDRAGHVRRGNEWVVGGRLEDARFFWTEDLKHPLDDLTEKLEGLVVHTKIGSYADKARRMSDLARKLASRVASGDASETDCARAAALAKNDLLTGTVGEFPELQGKVGGLLLEKEGAPAEQWEAVYSHYQPVGPEDPVPGTPSGRVVALADKLDAVTEFIRVGEVPTGSRDPFGLRRASNGIFRIVCEGQLALSLNDLNELAAGNPEVLSFLNERLIAFLKESGYSSNEVLAVVRPRISDVEVNGWALTDVVARLEAIRRIRDREDFRHLVKLTERVDTIVLRNAAEVAGLPEEDGFEETETAARALSEMVQQSEPLFAELAQRESYREIVEKFSGFVDPVEGFFQDVLVIDKGNPGATRSRYAVLERLRTLLTRYFDIRELAGEADRRG